MTDVAGKTIMRDGNGRLFQVEPAQVEALQRDQGWAVAPEADVQERVAAREQYSKYGSTGQQAQALAETVVRGGTGGAVKGFGSEEDIRGRANVVAEESPILDTAAQALPAVAAGVATAVATGGIGLVPAIAAQAAVGGAANVSVAEDEAFRRDETLSAESAWGAFGKGVLMGAAAEVGGAVLFRGARGVSNRFVEASGRAARRSEAAAFEAAGIVRPAKDLAKAVDDPAVAAAVRKTANEARESVQAQVSEAFDGLRSAEQAARAAEPPLGSVAGDVAEQRATVRPLFDDLRNELREMPWAHQAMEELATAENPSSVFAAVRNVRKAIGEAMDQSDNPELVKALAKFQARAQKLEQSPGLFGEVAETAAKRGQALNDLGEARAAFEQALADGPEYMRAVGTKGGKEIEDKLDVFAERLAAVDPDAGKAVARLLELRAGALEKVAAGNQVDALSSSVKTRPAGTSPMRDILGEVAETAVESMLPGAGLVRKAWKYRKHIIALAESARGASKKTAASLLYSAPARVAKRGSKFDAAMGKVKARQGQSGAATVGRRGSRAEEMLSTRLKGHEAYQAKISALEKRKAAGEVSEELDDEIALLKDEPPDSADIEEALTALKYELDDAGDLAGRRLREALDKAETSADLVKLARDILARRRSKPDLPDEILRKIDDGTLSTEAQQKAMVLSGEMADAKYSFDAALKRTPNGDRRKMASQAMQSGGVMGMDPEEFLKAVSQKSGQRGFAATGTGVRDILTSPMALAAGGAMAVGGGIRAYGELRDMVEKLSNDPVALADSMAEQFGDMPTEAPDLFMGVSAQAARAVAFLQTKIPPAFEFSLLYPDGPPPSQSDMLELQLYWRGATDPEAVLASIGDGSAMPEEVEAFRAVCPAWFEELRETTVLGVQEKARAGEPLGAYRVAQLEGLLDLNGKLDPTFGSSVATIYASVKASQAESQQAPSYVPPPKAGQRLSPES